MTEATAIRWTIYLVVAMVVVGYIVDRHALKPRTAGDFPNG